MAQVTLEPSRSGAGRDNILSRAIEFCSTVPYRQEPYSKRNWGGPLHSLCSYQGKLKPSIAHFLVQWFTRPGDRVLDPMGGVGTVALEARRLGRTGISSDLSPLAYAVARAKLESFDANDVWRGLEALDKYLAYADHSPDMSHAEFGLNGPIAAYFHQQTLREVLLSREYFLRQSSNLSGAAQDVLKSSLLHILHGNRPYALSRRSHPVTPFAPTGPATYRPVVAALRQRIDRILPHLEALEEQGPPGRAYQADFRKLDLDRPVDSVITSPPFAESIRFWTSNWMRLWFAGWSPEDFRQEPSRYLEVEQRAHFEAYQEFAEAMARLLKPGGTLIMHLGETAKTNMVTAIEPMLDAHFDIRFVGRESVADTESHGLRDKGATVAHWYLFAQRR